MSNEPAADATSILQRVVTEMRALSTDFDAMDEATAAFFGVNRTDSRCMDILSRRTAMGMGELARAMGLSTAAATTVVDRLVRAGHVRRMPDSRDRRRIQVQLTPAAQRRGQRVFENMIRTGTSLLESYSSTDLELVAEFIERTRAMVNEQTQVIRTRAQRTARHSRD